MAETIIFESFFAPFKKRIEEAEINYQEQVQRIQAKIKNLDDPRGDAQFNAKRKIMNLDIERMVGDGDWDKASVLRSELSQIEKSYTVKQEEKKRRLSELQEEKSRGEAEKERLIREVHSEFIPLAEDVFLRKMEDLCIFYEGVEPVLTRITGKFKHLVFFELGSGERVKKLFPRLKQFLPQLGG
ncbi:hypothetical protein FJZ41_03460 [Candidatus Shapirobacteria bacterium]|nr:hypothetical protein [Candidatus Shapirobacteria bacterium]